MDQNAVLENVGPKMPLFSPSSVKRRTHPTHTPPIGAFGASILAL